MEVINDEHKNAVQFARLMGAFLGDDPAYRRSDKLNLAAYNHLEGLEDPSNPNESSESAPPINKIEDKPKSTRRPSTRNQTAASQEADPFFALPLLEIDRDYGIRSDEAEDTRQLTQIAQQRSEEFIRCMAKVRNGLLRAERYQDKVYKWCQEMAGLADESDGMEHDTPAPKK